MIHGGDVGDPIMQLPREIKTKRLAIQPFCIAEADAFIAFMTDKKTTEFMFRDEQKTEKGAREFLDGIIASYSSETPYFFYAIRRNNVDGFVGTCGVSGLPDEGVWEPFCCLLPDCRCRGYATEALSALLDYCFSNYPVREFRAYVHPGNPRSPSLAERLGMTFAGRGNHPVYGDDSKVYSLRKTLSV